MISTYVALSRWIYPLNATTTCQYWQLLYFDHSSTTLPQIAYLLTVIVLKPSVLSIMLASCNVTVLAVKDIHRLLDTPVN